MKFVCDSCSTKYSIADERVKGRVLKIRCKTCNHVITVKEDMARPQVAVELKRAPNQSHTIGIPLLGEDANENTVVGGMPGMVGGAPSPMADPDEWYVSFDGEQEGPLAFDRASERVRVEVGRGKEAHAWRPGFFVWLPIEDVPEFARALALAKGPSLPQKAAPRPALRATGARAVISPEALKAEQARRDTGPKPILAEKKNPTGRQPAIPADADARKKESTTGPRPRKDPTGPRAALVAVTPGAASASGAPVENVPAADSKPMALPPPPSPLQPLAPDSIAPPPPRNDPSVPIQIEAQVTRPEKKAALPAPSHAPPPPADDVSPYRAALHSNAPDSPVRAPDTGPVPLPPPPVGDDLPIDEPSSILNLSPNSPIPVSRPTSRPVIDTFGGAAVTPSSQNGAAQPAPVVVVAGPAGHRAPPWMKWAAAAGLVGSLGLGAVVIYLLVRHPAPQPAPPPKPEVAQKPPIEDKPITVVDPAPPPQQPAPAPVAQDPKRPLAATKRAPVAHPPAKNDSLSSQQKNLAALYNDQNDHAQHALPPVDHAQHGGNAQASQAAILAVVTQNRRALNLCYDRVLKHDQSLKRARLMTHVKVGLSGTVLAVTVPDPQFSGSEIATCITQSIKHWHFPAADGEYETEFPIILQAD
ncbi:MAG TPA: AgmX/PglI C-terminal domain-containing protein [Polyangia bacterium]|nr:AgmX/PglI C-terminal domain-containing protein [Polyangia bacterium]